ncbi:PF11697 family protein [Leptospira santarosai]|uniref:PF11697 family protein n=1 Tax=Leptospira santarosai TaxID=28183 RepID=A0A2P1QR74_9LEPT|nr:PF11697 family protein [Leptospira santarosai]
MDENLRREYLNTCYMVNACEEFSSFVILAESFNPTLDEILNRYDRTEWAYITAWNPKSIPLFLEENQKRNHLLEEKICAGAYPSFRGKGIGTDETWIPEESFLILGIAEKVVAALAIEFDQNSILVGTIGNKSRLKFLT